MQSPYQIKLQHLIGKVWLFLLSYLVILLACLTIKILFTREEIYFAVNGRYTPWGDVIFPLITNLGDGLAVVLLGLGIALYSYRKSFLLLTGYGLTALVAQVLKFFFDKPRPYLYFVKVHGKMHLVKGITMLNYHSFPSGHTTTIFSACLTLAYLFSNKYLDLLMLCTAIAVGYSRMYLSEHFLEDVTAGSAVGVFVTLFWLRWLDSRPFIHQGKWQQGLVWSKRVFL